jgi:hypothetical protein
VPEGGEKHGEMKGGEKERHQGAKSGKAVRIVRILRK